MKSGWAAFVIAVVLAVAASVVRPAALQSESARILLEAAKKKEVVDGNLEAAIQVYREILARFPEDRFSGAQALLGLAEGLRKMGSPEALSAYDRIVREFPDQPAAAVAQVRRAALSPPPKPGPGDTRVPQPPMRDARLGVTVGGRVVRLGHNAGSQVDFQNSQTGATRSAAIASDGSFEFVAILPGTYQARITPGLSALPPIAILVGDQDIHGLEFTIPLAIVDVSLTVRTVVEGAAGIPAFQLQFMPVRPVAAIGLPPNFADTGVRIPISTATLQRTFPPQQFPPAEYRVRVVPPPPNLMPPGFAVRSITAGSVDVLNRPLKISPAEPLELKVVLAAKAVAEELQSARSVLDDEPNLALRLGAPQQPRIVEGTVEVENGGPVPRFRLRFDAGTVTRSLPVAGSSFSVSLPAGDYRTAVIELPPGYEVRSIVDATSDLTFWPLSIAADRSGVERPDTRPRVTITLAATPEMRLARISGRVVGNPAVTRVKLVGTIQAEDLVTRTGPDGSFEFSQVLPGSYTVWLMTDGIVSMRMITVDVGASGLAGLEIDASRFR